MVADWRTDWLAPISRSYAVLFARLMMQLMAGGPSKPVSGRNFLFRTPTIHPAMSQAPKPDKPDTAPAVSAPAEDAGDEPDDWYAVPRVARERKIG